jgi:hypothetical protein
VQRVANDRFRGEPDEAFSRLVKHSCHPSHDFVRLGSEVSPPGRLPSEDRFLYQLLENLLQASADPLGE